MTKLHAKVCAALEKVGLKLQKSRALLEHLVIDQIDKTPADN
ncbi:MAG TPA: hypothetical protein VHC90_24400 [Bryobacteraceae bacterium]|nr:hypothetical protein [Bryobacteraceae bacterium]